MRLKYISKRKKRKILRMSNWDKLCMLTHNIYNIGVY